VTALAMEPVMGKEPSFDQSAIYEAEARILASYREIYGAHLEPSAVDLRDWALALLVEESKVTK
jgi:hypothetical protein